MAHRSLDRGFQISPVLVARLKQHGVNTVRELMELSTLDFLSYDINYTDAQEILMKVSSKVSNVRYLGTAGSLWKKNMEVVNENDSIVSTGLNLLDTHLRGGLKVGTITEVCGAPGVGKVGRIYQVVNGFIALFAIYF